MRRRAWFWGLGSWWGNERGREGLGGVVGRGKMPRDEGKGGIRCFELGYGFFSSLEGRKGCRLGRCCEWRGSEGR